MKAIVLTLYILFCCILLASVAYVTVLCFHLSLLAGLACVAVISYEATCVLDKVLQAMR